LDDDAEADQDAIGASESVPTGSWQLRQFPARQIDSTPFRRSLVRPEDLLVVCFEFFGFHLDTTAPHPRLVRRSATTHAFLVVCFPPQSFAEQSFFETATNEPPTKTRVDRDYENQDNENLDLVELPVRGRIAGPSRLAFRMPAELEGVEYSLAALLEACRVWEPSVVPVALPAPAQDIWPPTPGQRVLQHHLAGISSAFRADAVETAKTHLRRSFEHDLAAALELEIVRIGIPRDAARKAISASVQRVMQQAGEEIAQASFVDETEFETILLRGVSRVIDDVGRTLTGSGLLQQIPGLAVYLRPTPPAETDTAIELPYRLVISPNRHARWLHATNPVERAGRTELWHTRLGIMDAGKVTENDHQQRSIRAIWSPDYRPLLDPANDDNPLSWGLPEQPDSANGVWTSLRVKNRNELVRLTSDFSIVDTEAKPDTIYTPTPASVHQLMLSALGGWLDAEGAWEHKPESIDLLAWRHLSTMGRDHYVRVIEKGHLFPFRHAAVRVTVTERRFHTHAGRRVAFLRTRQFVFVRQRVVAYPEIDTPEGRRFPFRRIEALTLVTPNLAPTGWEPSYVQPAAPASWTAGDVFWPWVGGELKDAKIEGGEPFHFRFAAEDLGGRRITLSCPVVFALGSVVSGENVKANVNAVAASYLEKPDRRTPWLGGYVVRYAESFEEGDTDLETESISVAGKHADQPKGSPDFWPYLEKASVRIPAIQHLLGDDETVDVSFAKTYLENGFGGSANKGEVFLERVSTKHVRFAGSGKADMSGALISPDFTVAGLSRKRGPVGGSTIDNIAADVFKPIDFFPDAMLFGGLFLYQILASDPTEAPPSLTVHGAEGETKTTTYSWMTTQFNPDHEQFIAKPGSQLKVVTTLKTTSNAPANVETLASLVNFDVNLFGFVTIPFEQVQFRSLPNEKPQVSVRLAGPVTFGGPLAFVNTLRQYIPADGFSDPPDIAVTDAGITASFGVEVPTLQIGIFSLQNMALGAGFLLPFDDRKMAVRFNFAERHDTFAITVSAFGGGGFLSLELSADGPVAIEGALEFGGALALNIGVASGGVYVKAGIYFSWAIDQTTGKEAVVLSGFVEIGGSLSVIGLINVSIIFNLSLTYTGDGKVYGQATLYVEVEVLCFSETVPLTVEKQFAGSDGDPSFVDLIPTQTVWDAYCEAFLADVA